MMTQARATSLKSIAIHKDQVLGVGAYGTVYKATCDGLQCAAKVLHADLILTDQQTQTVRPEDRHRLPMKRFEEDLELICHPNIILFLGMSWDSTGLPALLMELMDENLTTFLERDPDTPLQFHIQVSICHDVATALSYLHFNEMYHRNLSSNNILMTRERRAKVTDFGMAVFEGAHQKRIEMPGTAAYMPPEVKGAYVVFSDKTDVFSLGVLMIQIMTRLFPEPVQDLPSIGLKSWSEIDKRQNHISLVAKDHPLLAIATSCLEDNHEDRPSSSEVCRQVGDMKQLDYVSVQQVVPDVNCHKRAQECGSLHSPTEPEKKRIKVKHYHQQDFGNLAEKAYEPFEEIHLHEITSIFPPPFQVQDISKNVGLVWHLMQQKTPTPMYRNGSGAVVLEDHIYMLHGENHNILHSLHPSHDHHQWQSHPPPPVELGSLALVNNRVVLVGGLNSSKLYSLIDGEWKNKLPSMPTKRYSVTITSSSSYLIAIGGVGKGRKYVQKVEVMDIGESRWFSVANFPEPCAGLSACICNRRVYVLGKLNSVFVSEMETLLNCAGVTDIVSRVGVWERMQELPVSSATCIGIQNELYVVGGKSCHGMATTAIHRYNERNKNWCICAHMKEARSQCFVAMVKTAPPTMLAVGGVNRSGHMSDTIESSSWH